MRPDQPGSRGIGWLERWSIQMNKPLGQDDGVDPPAAIQQAYERLVGDLDY
ncbi:MAG: hypothetical protein KGL44_13540 [Sphingomonadales bacterium]|nr:hypothetical protein [Sphingomonadales bacterium]